MQKTAALFPFDGMIARSSEEWLDSFYETVSRVPSLYRWACDHCLKAGRALLGNPAKQFYTFRFPWDAASPYLAYIDQKRKCQKCATHFVFSKEEQQHWYETLRFVVYARPVNCAPCRKTLREARGLHKELSDLLRDGRPEDGPTLERIADIYEVMGKVEKMKAYRTYARKSKT